MAEEHELQAHSKRDNTMLYALIAVAIIAVAAIGYAAMQGDSFNKRITQLEQTQAASSSKLDSSLAQINSTLTNFNEYISSRLADVEATLTLYYDSDCPTCKNDILMNGLEKMAPDLKQKGITFKEVDVRGGNFDALVADGINRVPALYASSDDLNKVPAGTNLKNIIDSWAASPSVFDYYYVQGGIALSPKSPAEMLTEPCLSNKTTLQYFYSETCQYCKRVKSSNGTVVNPESNPQYANVISESLSALETEFGGTLDVSSHCLGVHLAYDNNESLGIDKSDDELCVETQGQNKTTDDAALAAKYRFSQPPTVPVFVVNCKYLFRVNGTTADAIKQPLCAIKPSLAACKT